MTMFLLRSLVAQALLIAVCIGGDYLLATRSNLSRAIYDSVTHGTVGFLAWMIVSGASAESWNLSSVLLCGFLASAIDIDHVIAAHSFKLQNVLHLTHRPFLHNTLVILLMCVTLWLLDKALSIFCNITVLHMVPWMCLVAWISHHTRDANRRGFWFGPLGSTPPLPQWLYIGLIITLAWTVALVMHRCTKATGGVIYLNGPDPQGRDHVIIEL